MKLTFDIRYAGEKAAGLHPFTDTVHIECESGEWGGQGATEFEHSEFAIYMRECLESWYDGANVEIVK